VAWCGLVCIPVGVSSLTSQWRSLELFVVSCLRETRACKLCQFLPRGVARRRVARLCIWYFCQRQDDRRCDARYHDAHRRVTLFRVPSRLTFLRRYVASVDSSSFSCCTYPSPFLCNILLKYNTKRTRLFKPSNANYLRILYRSFYDR
jgi:hypothetical protein